jgi:hypothetical protein
VGLAQSAPHPCQGAAPGRDGRLWRATAVTASDGAAGGRSGKTALRRGAHAAAWTALALNAVLVLVMAYTFLDAVRMTFWPGWTFPFGA